MNQSQFLKKVFTKKAQDYSYTIAFFLIFSFFIVAVIRPNVVSVFSSNAKIKELEDTNRILDSQITNVLQIQTAIEQSRDDFFLLKETIATNPQVNKVLSDFNEVTNKNNLTIERMNIADVNLKETTNTQKLKSIALHADVSGKYEDFVQFISDLYGQRRLKIVKKLTIARDGKAASESANLKMQVDVEGYYL